MNKQVITLNTPEGRASFVYVFVPTKRYNPTNDPSKDVDSYELELMFDKATTNLEALTGAINQAIENQWPGGTMPQGVVFPIHDGDIATCSMSDPTLKSVKFPEYAGKWFIRIKSSIKPPVFWQTIQGQPAREITSDNDFYAGCNCIVNVNVAAYHVGNSVGVNFYLNQIMMTTQGERLGSGQVKDPSVFPALPPGQMPAQQQAPAPGFQQPGAPTGLPATGGPVPSQQIAPQPGAQVAPLAASPTGQPVQPQQPGQQFPPPAPGGQVPQQ